MNEGLNDFLSRMGIEQTASDRALESIVPPQEVQEAIDVIVEEGPPVISDSHSPSLSDGDLDDILNDMGFEEDGEGEVEGNTDGPVYVGDGIMAQIRNFSMEPMQLAVTDDGVVGADGTLVMSRQMMDEMADEIEHHHENVGEGRDLDAEEDEDWNELIDSGVIRPVSTIDQVSVHRSDGSVTVEPIVNEAADAADAVATMIASSTRRAVRERQEEAVEETTIPENSPTLLIDDTTSRFSGAEWYEEIQKKRIILGGAGGIGSFVGFQIARMKPQSLIIYDDDIVEEANMSGQMYSRNDIGKKKVRALMDIIQTYTNTSGIYANPFRFTVTTEGGDIMMCGFDNMEARKTFFNVWYLHVMDKDPEERKNCLYLDGRLSINVLQVFCLTGDDEYNMEKYREEYLFDDSEAEETICSLKQTTYMACMIGSFMVNLFTNWCANILDPVIPYDLPFFTEYDAQNMLFKTIGR